MFKDELKNWKWAAIPVFTIIKKKKSYNSRVFTAQPKQAKESLNLWLNKIWVWHQSESDASILCLPSGWFLEHLVEGSRAWIQQDTLSQKRSLSECIWLFCISQRDWAIGWVGNVNPEAPQQPRAKSGILSNEVAICERAICQEQTFSVPVDLLNSEVRWIWRVRVDTG